jgi:hypothetical protein
MANLNKVIGHLSASEWSQLLTAWAEEFQHVPEKQTLTYQVKTASPSLSLARQKCYQSLQPNFIKQAFDTRRIDQDHDRNPRSNLQYWHRSQEFIEEEDQIKLDLFAKLLPALDRIKNKFGAQPEYLQSYAKVLHETVLRTLRVKEGDLDIYRPQINYLEQLLDTRYRLSMQSLAHMPEVELYNLLIKKDESLLKRGSFLPNSVLTSEAAINKSGDQGVTQQAIVNAIFGNNNFRKDSEKSVTRTITITVTDTVND